MNNLTKRILSSAILLPLVFFFILNGSFLSIFFIITVFFIAAYEWYLMTKNKFYKIYGFIFLVISFYIFYKISLNVIEVFFVITICVSTDIGGYLFGKIFKGPKLTKISPNKTYSGMIGAYFLSFLFVILIVNFTDFHEISLELFVLIFMISTASQIGDLIISYFKRLSKIKNTGKIIPGHGGLLDRIDGMIFAFPIYYAINVVGYFFI